MAKIDKTDNLNLRSEEVQEILSNPPIWIVRWGITLIFAFTCILLTLSFIIKYPDFVTAKVIITTKEPTQRVIAHNQGQLQQLFIKNKDQVYKNQKLAIIENTASYEDVYLLKKILDTIQFDKNDLSFPPVITSNLQLGDIEATYANFTKSYIDYFLLKDLDPYTNQLKGNKLSLTEIKAQLVNQINQKKLLEQEFDLKKTDFERYQKLFNRGVVSQQEYESKSLEYIQMQKNISSMAISISQMRETIGSANQSLKKTNINAQSDNIKLLTNLIQAFNTLKKSIQDWEYKYVLNSSIDGIVSFQQFWGVNQFVNSGDIIFTILPDNTDDLVGKLVLPSQNSGKVTLDQKVLIKLDNYPYQQFGMLIGKVQSISISPDNNDNYFVYISLPNAITTSYNRKLIFKQELIGNAEIITEDLSVAERLFYKFKDIFKYN